jgi:enoyl-CoA hydratase/carnithine racemase
MIEMEKDGPIWTLVLARPPVNALNREMLIALTEAIGAAEASAARGLILTGAGTRFSAGLDVTEVRALDRDGLRTFLRTFFGCLRALARCPLPLVAAVNGASPAGGAVLALHCDRRIFVREGARIGLNEVQVGLYPGAMIHGLLQRIVGDRVAAECLMTGALLDGSEALTVGLVDELAEPTGVRIAARRWLDRLLALPPGAFAATRALVRRDLVALNEAMDDAALEAVVEAWMSEEARRTLEALLRRP